MVLKLVQEKLKSRHTKVSTSWALLYLLCFAFLLSSTTYKVNLCQYYKVNIKREIYGKMSGKPDNKCRCKRLRCLATIPYSCYLQIWSYTACGVRRLASLYRPIFLFFYNSSKIEKDDKSPGEESDISDDDTGLLFIIMFFLLLFILNVLKIGQCERVLFNDFGYSKRNSRTSRPLRPITTKFKNSVSQSRFGAKPQSIKSAGKTRGQDSKQLYCCSGPGCSKGS